MLLSSATLGPLARCFTVTGWFPSCRPGHLPRRQEEGGGTQQGVLCPGSRTCPRVPSSRPLAGIRSHDPSWLPASVGRSSRKACYSLNELRSLLIRKGDWSLGGKTVPWIGCHHRIPVIVLPVPLTLFLANPSRSSPPRRTVSQPFSRL